MATLHGMWRRFFQNAIDIEHPIASLSRWPRWLIACALGKPVVAYFRTGGLRMRLTPKLTSFGSTSIYIKRDHYEPELLSLRRLVREGDVALDIGASFGIFSLFLGHFVGPRGRVYSFEPGKFSYSQLSENVSINEVGKRITAFNAAASDKPALLRLFHLGDSPVNFSVGESNSVSYEEVPALSVSSQVPIEDQARVRFIKIDVEGYEKFALEGTRAILEATHPVIMFEVSKSALARQSMTPEEMYGYLTGYGYRFWELDGTGHFIPIKGFPDGNIFASIHDLKDH